MNGSDLIFKLKEFYTPESKAILEKLGEIGKKVKLNESWDDHRPEFWEAYDLTVKLNSLFETHFSVKDLVLAWDDITDEDDLDDIILNSMNICNIFLNSEGIRTALSYAYLEVTDLLDDEASNLHDEKVRTLINEGDSFLLGVMVMCSIAEIREAAAKPSIMDLLDL